MSDNCLHPYNKTFRADVDMLHNNIPQDRKTVRVCKECKRVIDIENNRSTTFKSPAPPLGCDHPYDSVFKKN